MRWPWQPHREGRPSQEAVHALEHDRRHLEDGQALGRAAGDLIRRAEEVNDQWREVKRRNGVADAFAESILKGRAQHS